MSLINTEIRTGEALHVGEYEITPQTRVSKIQSPGGHFGLIWNRPKAVVVRTANGKESILPVVDVTRITIWAMLAAGILGAIMVGLVSPHR